MAADAERLGWTVAIAGDAGVHFLDPSRARVAKEVRLTKEAVIDNLVGWLDERTKRLG